MNTHFTFNEEDFNRLFPFFILINKDLKVESTGKSLHKISPIIKNKKITDSFSIIRPELSNISVDSIQSITNKLIIIQCHNKQKTILRGQIEYLKANNQFLFLGSPWMNSMEEVIDNHLTLNDFAFHDPLIDLLHVLKTQEITNQDLKELLINLQKAELEVRTSLIKEKKLNELKSRFISTTSHEFKTPLTVIKSSVELIKLYLAKGKTDINFSNTLSVINKEVDELTQLMHDILILEKLNSNRIKLSLHSADPVKIIHQINEKFRLNEHDNRKAILRVNGTKRNLQIDVRLLNTIITNLLSNALKYSQGKESPVIEVSFLENEVTIIINDFGIGIPKADQDQLFSSFFRAKNADHIEGTGLGLTIVKELVELLRGKIEITSEENKGTSITLHFYQ